MAEQAFTITASKGAVGEVKCMADVKEDFFETSVDRITVAILDLSVSPGSTRNVGESVAVTHGTQ